MMSLLNLWYQHIKREQLLYWRDRRTSLHACLFFLMLTIFAPLTMPPQAELLHQIAPGLIWIALLLAFFLASERLFQMEYDEGIIEQWLLSDHPLGLLISAKIMTHWILTLLPMLIFCPLFALLFQLSLMETGILMLSVLVGSPTILALCALAATLGGHIKHNGLMMAMIVLPLTIPVMILGSATLTLAIEHQPITANLALLLAFSILSMTLLPLAMASVIRLSWND